MAYSHYERLSAMDALFLEIEDHNSHMHIGSVAVFDTGPLRTAAGGIDIDSIRVHLEGATAKHVRFRQRLQYVPGLGRPVWVDDARFNLAYHVRHTCLPAPGDERILKRLAGRIMSQQLDRGKPLWEAWFVEGVEGDRFAVITKLHHCLADGISGVDLTSSMVGADPKYRAKKPKTWTPRPAPSGGRLLADEVRRRAGAPLALLTQGEQGLWRDVDDLRNAARGLLETFGGNDGGAASETIFDADLGPHRRFDWSRFEMADVKLVKDRLGGKVNDVVLAAVAGGLRKFFRQRNMVLDDLNFRVMVPVSVRSDDERGSLGNRVSMMLVRLPLDLTDPVERFHRIADETSQRKSGHQRDVSELLARAADAVLPELTGPLARLGMRSHAANLVVTNVPGPPMPVYLLGARQLEVYPVVPLAAGQALGIALLSYADGLFWGFNSDWDALPDLHDLVDAVSAEFDVLYAAAEAIPGAAAPRRRGARKSAPSRKKSRKAMPKKIAAKARKKTAAGATAKARRPATKRRRRGG